MRKGFGAAIDSSVVTLTGTQTVTGKTLVAPTVKDAEDNDLITTDTQLVRVADGATVSLENASFREGVYALSVQPTTLTDNRIIVWPNASGTISLGTVATGGTGLSSATAYAVLCGGTTSTGAFQSVASVGTTGQVLTSNGAGALPTFQTINAGTRNLEIFAAASIPRVTSGCGVGGYETSTNKNNYDTLNFATGVDSYADVWRQLPDNFTGTTITVKFAGQAASGSGQVKMTCAARCFKSGDSLDLAVGTAQTATMASVDTNFNVSSATSAITLECSGTPAAGDWVLFKIGRNGSAESGGLAADFRLLFVGGAF